jgi:signal peptidase I
VIDEQTKRPNTFWRELPVLLGVAIIVAVVVRAFVLQTFYIPSESMENTLLIRDRVLVNKLVYDFRSPHRGEVIVFEAPDSWRNDPSEEDFIKRVIALPGETWEIRAGDVYVDGSKLAEPYLVGPADQRDFGPETVPAGTLFVLGDNRLHSCDSRFPPDDAGECHGLGYVPVDNVIGQAFAIVWPPSDVGWLR